MWQFYDTTGKVIKEIDFDKVPADQSGMEQ
jgi:hypothetical protein